MMKTPSKLPLISSPEIPPVGPTFGPCPEKVDDGGGELREVSAAEEPDTPAVTRDLLERAHAIHVSAMCPTAPGGSTSPPGGGLYASASAPASPQDLPERFTWSVRVLIQLILMFLRTPPTTKAQGHPPNADTRLVPAIDGILKYAGAIDETDGRIFRKVDVQQVAQQRDTLLFLREMRKIFVVSAQCVDAGISQVEQYLDGSARFIYTRLVTELGGDLLLQQDLQGLTELVGGSIAAAQETKKSNARAAAGQPGDAGTEPGATGSTGAGPGVHVTVTPPTSPVMAPVGPVAGPLPPARLATGARPAAPAPRGGRRRKG